MKIEYFFSHEPALMPDPIPKERAVTEELNRRTGCRGASTLHADRQEVKTTWSTLESFSRSYLNRARRLRLIRGTVRSSGARKQKVTNKDSQVGVCVGEWEAKTVLQTLNKKNTTDGDGGVWSREVYVCMCEEHSIKNNIAWTISQLYLKILDQYHTSFTLMSHRHINVTLMSYLGHT